MSSFIKKSSAIDYGSSFAKNVFLSTSYPVFSNSNQTDASFYTSVYYFIKKNKKKLFFRFFKKHFYSKRYFRYIGSIIKSAVSLKKFGSFRNKEFLNAYSVWLNTVGIVSVKVGSYNSNFFSTTNNCYFFSQLTGFMVLKKKNTIDFFKTNSVASNHLNLYNMRTYNWLITI